MDPSHTSINTVINSTKFQCAWGSFSECYLLVADALEGTQAAVFDVDAAFRNIPTHPSARPFLAIMIRGRIHLDQVLNFGASPSPGIFGRVADSLTRQSKSTCPGASRPLSNGWMTSFFFITHAVSCSTAPLNFVIPRTSSGISRTS